MAKKKPKNQMNQIWGIGSSTQFFGQLYSISVPTWVTKGQIHQEQGLWSLPASPVGKSEHSGWHVAGLQ